MKFLAPFAALALLAAPAAEAATFRVTINTSPVAGVVGKFAFDFIGNGQLAATTPGQQANTVTISNISVVGGSFSGVDAALTTGGVSGTAPGPFTLTDAAEFFNSLVIDIVLGSVFSFDYTTTTNIAQPQPTGFAGTILNAAGLPLFPTDNPFSDPNDPANNSGTLFAHTIDGVGPRGEFFETYSAPNGVATSISEVPIPGALPLFLAGIAGLTFVRRSKLAA